MARPDMGRVELGGHGLDALALSRQEKTRDISPQRLPTVGMTYCRAQSLQVLLEPLSFRGSMLDHGISLPQLCILPLDL